MYCKICGQSLGSGTTVCPKCGQVTDNFSGGTGFWDLIQEAPKRNIQSQEETTVMPAPKVGLVAKILGGCILLLQVFLIFLVIALAKESMKLQIEVEDYIDGKITETETSVGDLGTDIDGLETKIDDLIEKTDDLVIAVEESEEETDETDATETTVLPENTEETKTEESIPGEYETSDEQSVADGSEQTLQEPTQTPNMNFNGGK